MQKIKNIFLKKKILVYGLGKSGLSTYNFLKKKSEVYLFDDKKISVNKHELKKKILKISELKKKIFDYIILSPGINIKKCKLSSFVIKNFDKIFTDLDVFYSSFNNKKITITGTNGKSTTAKILHDILKDQKFDVRLVGNIGNPVLLEKNIKKNTIFVIEASSYQLDYSKIFRSDYSAILNISPDHLERHGNLKNYVKAKFKLIKNQKKTDVAFLNKKDSNLIKLIKNNRILSKIIHVDKIIDKKLFEKIDNNYFATHGNQQNLSFIFQIVKKLNLNKNETLRTLNKFNGLNYRQQIIFNKGKLIIINDSKSTSFSSSISFLKSAKNIFWIMGGIPKIGDKFILTKKNCKNFYAYIYGKNKKKFIRAIKNKIYFKSFKDLKTAVNKVFLDIKSIKNEEVKVIFFSPSAASFDSFKNFEERGEYFNRLIEKKVNGK